MGIRQWFKNQGIGASPEHYYKIQYRNEMQRQLKEYMKKNGRKPTVNELVGILQGSHGFRTIATLGQLNDGEIKNMAKHLLEVECN
jgi:hypothetical protein